MEWIQYARLDIFKWRRWEVTDCKSNKANEMREVLEKF